MAQSCSYSPSICPYFPSSSPAHYPKGFCPVEDSWLSYLREMCDRYFDPRDCDPGAGSTRFYSDGIENANYLAELALKFYNEKERKNFYLEKVGKINKFVVLRCLTFWARTAESDERSLFRGVVDLLEDQVLLCEIKGGNEITIPDDHSENCRLKRSRIYDYVANDSAGGSISASFGSAVGLGGVDLSNLDGFSPMGHSMLWALRDDDDEITSPVDNSENCRLKRSWIDDYDADGSADGSVDASSGVVVGRGGVDLGTVDGFFPRDDSRLSYLRDMCDRYFDPRDCDPGAGSTRFYSDGIENVNYLAELALKFYNEKERKNFCLEKVGKINKFVVLRCLTFWARTAESDESRLFRGVVDLLEDKVLLCEIKGGNEIMIPDNHSENCRLNRSRIPYYLANDSVGCSVDASSGAAGGLGSVGLCPMNGSDVASGSLE